MPRPRPAVWEAGRCRFGGRRRCDPGSAEGRCAGPHYRGEVHRIFTTSVASVYPHYVAKVEKKGRTNEELDQVIRWLTGFDESALRRHRAKGKSMDEILRV